MSKRSPLVALVLATSTSAFAAPIISGATGIKGPEQPVNQATPAGISPALAAGATVYSNVTSYFGSVLPNGDAAAGNLATDLVMDDCTTVVGSAGTDVGFIRFSMANLNATALSASPCVRFFAVDPTTDLPTAVLGGVNFNPVTVSAQSVTLVSYSAAAPIFTVPAGEKVYAGVFFLGGGANTTTTAAQLNNFGMGIFDPPTVGSSDGSVLWASDVAATDMTSYGVNAPAGALYNLGTGTPANFAFFFQAIPEPSSLALLAPATLLFARRRAR